ncbi:MAG: spore coat protein [Lachnospiraceae bacterium]|nr:spore coat protein [Lachnospiraceae bacterium]
MQSVYTEKEILGDALTAQKTATSEMNISANECVHEDVRQTMLHILSQEHDIQQDVFNMMHEKGYYPTPMAEQKKVDETKQQYCQCVK